MGQRAEFSLKLSCDGPVKSCPTSGILVFHGRVKNDAIRAAKLLGWRATKSSSKKLRHESEREIAGEPWLCPHCTGRG